MEPSKTLPLKMLSLFAAGVVGVVVDVLVVVVDEVVLVLDVGVVLVVVVVGVVVVVVVEVLVVAAGLYESPTRDLSVDRVFGP